MARRDLPSLFAILFLLLLAPVVPAQDTAVKTVAQPQAAAPAAKPAARNKGTTAAEKARLDQRKALGLSLLVSLANDARNYQDQRLRARTLSRIADALWEADPEQGRGPPSWPIRTRRVSGTKIASVSREAIPTRQLRSWLDLICARKFCVSRPNAIAPSAKSC